MQRSKTGEPQRSAYEDPLFQQSLAPLCKELNKHNSSSEKPVSEMSLALTVFELELHMEKMFGRNSPKPRTMTKLPAHLFRNFDINGPLHKILSIIYSDAKAKTVECEEYFSTQPPAILSELLVRLESALVQDGWLKWPKIFLKNVPVRLINSMSEIVSRHRGQMVTTEDEATHVVDWIEEIDGLGEEVTEDFVRVLDLGHDTDGEERARVHWWYYPDSYDQWIPGTEVDTTEPSDLSTLYMDRKKWSVCCKFVLDCETFNEWGNPLDYEKEGEDEGPLEPTTPLQPSTSSRKAKGKRKHLGPSSHKAAKDTPILQAMSVADKVLPNALPASVTGQPVSVMEISAAQGSGISYKLSGDVKEEGFTVGEKRKDRESNQPEWFQADSISDFERRYLWMVLPVPGAVDEGSKESKENQSISTSCVFTENDYIKLRQDIIKMYNQNTSQYMSATECRRNFPGDTTRILRLHEFLDAFRLINHSCPQRSTARSEETTFGGVTTFSGLSALAMSGSEAPVEKRPKSEQSPWSQEMDRKLLDRVKECKDDWSAIAAGVGMGFTPQQCLLRFVEMRLQGGVEGAVESKNIGKHGILSFTPDNTKLITLITELKNNLSADEGLIDVASSLIKKAAHDNVKKEEGVIDLMLKDYMKTRISVFEKKLDLLEKVETLIDADRERLDIEKNDLKILRAQISATSNPIVRI